jgi:hypothetical protein
MLESLFGNRNTNAVFGMHALLPMSTWLLPTVWKGRHLEGAWALEIWQAQIVDALGRVTR